VGGHGREEGRVRLTAQHPRMIRSCHFVPGAEGVFARASAIRRMMSFGLFDS